MRVIEQPQQKRVGSSRVVFSTNSRIVRQQMERSSSMLRTSLPSSPDTEVWKWSGTPTRLATRFRLKLTGLITRILRRWLSRLEKW